MTEPVRPEGTFPPDPAPVLLSGSSPSDLVELAIDDEFDLIEKSVGLGSHREHLRVLLSHRTEVEEFVGKLQAEHPSVVHFSGHGNASSELFFEDADGRSVGVGVEELERVFAAFSGIVRCVVLNACYSAPQGEAVANHVDCVVGMSDRVSDAAAHLFGEHFYKALASGRDVATAFDLAVVNIDLAGIPEAKTPALFGRERAALLVFDGRSVDDMVVTTSIVEGIEATARELYESEYLELVRLASTIIDSVSVCEGVVQEAFVKVLTSAIAPKQPGREGVLGVLREMVLEIAQGRRDLATEMFPAQPPPVAKADDDEVTKVLRAIQSLADNEAAALLLTQAAKLDPSALANALGLDADAAAATVASALDGVTAILEAVG